MLFEQVASALGGALGLLHFMDKLRPLSDGPVEVLLQVATTAPKLGDRALGGVDGFLGAAPLSFKPKTSFADCALRGY